MRAQFLRVRAYYNEFEPFAARWLRELIREGLIPEGDVDDRSITDVEPADLKDYTQCHFFAGIGGWAYATRLARWPDSRPIWTGSPPCQPFSVAGKRLGTDDERHLWPVWFNLVRECRPPTIFGEQVSAAVRHGWLDQLQADLEDSDYAVGSVIVPASGVGALHRRERLWFVAHASGERLQGNERSREAGEEKSSNRHSTECGGLGVELADTISERWSGFGGQGQEGVTEHCEANGLAYSNYVGHERGEGTGWEAQWRSEHASKPMRCKDGRVRLIPLEPEIFPLADGVSNRVGILRGAGNAIVPQVAAEIMKIFI